MGTIATPSHGSGLGWLAPRVPHALEVRRADGLSVDLRPRV
jgi:hypothetical protein